MTKRELWDAVLSISGMFSESILNGLCPSRSASTCAELEHALCVLRTALHCDYLSWDSFSSMQLEELYASLPFPYGDHLRRGWIPKIKRLSATASADDLYELGSSSVMGMVEALGIRGRLYWEEGGSPHFIAFRYGSDGSLMDLSWIFDFVSVERPVGGCLVLDVRLCLNCSVETLSCLGYTGYANPKDFLTMFFSLPLEDQRAALDQWSKVQMECTSLFCFSLLYPLMFSSVSYDSGPQRLGFGVYDTVVRVLRRKLGYPLRPAMRFIGSLGAKLQFEASVASQGYTRVLYVNLKDSYSDAATCWIRHYVELGDVSVKGRERSVLVEVFGCYVFGAVRQWVLGYYRCEEDNGEGRPVVCAIVNGRNVGTSAQSVIGHVVEVRCCGFDAEGCLISPRIVRVRFDCEASCVHYPPSYFAMLSRS